MVLAGLTPDVVMDIATRALSFYSFQVNYELRQQALTLADKTQTIANQEAVIQSMNSQGQVELSRQQHLVQAHQQELQVMRTEMQALQERLAEKNRQYHRLQTLYDASRRKHALSGVQPRVEPDSVPFPSEDPWPNSPYGCLSVMRFDFQRPLRAKLGPEEIVPTSSLAWYHQQVA
eukprot:m.124618 g.124618  ORF g.124618 m.124618 type:complete len:176 (-) comp52185_c0_seq21:400-927(-)